MLAAASACEAEVLKNSSRICDSNYNSYATRSERNAFYATASVAVNSIRKTISSHVKSTRRTQAVPHCRLIVQKYQLGRQKRRFQKQQPALYMSVLRSAEVSLGTSCSKKKPHCSQSNARCDRAIETKSGNGMRPSSGTHHIHLCKSDLCGPTVTGRKGAANIVPTSCKRCDALRPMVVDTYL